MVKNEEFPAICCHYSLQLVQNKRLRSVPMLWDTQLEDTVRGTWAQIKIYVTLTFETSMLVKEMSSTTPIDTSVVMSWGMNHTVSIDPTISLIS